MTEFKIGDRVKLNNSDSTLTGIVFAVSKPQPKYNNLFYFVEWSNGWIGLPNGDKIELIEEKRTEVKND